ncbi:MAG: SRPBCC family protein [Acidobacteriota bacterium]
MANDPLRSRLVGVNVPGYERIASVAAGGVLAVIGARRKGVGGALLAVLGGGLVLRGVTGRCGLYRMRAVRKGIEVRRAVTVQASPQEVYELWRDLRNLPRFMAHVRSVELEADGTSRWVIEEGGRQLSWRAELTEETPGRRLRWQSLPGGDLDHQGILDLHEAPGGRGTVVEVRMLYRPPGGLFVAGELSGFLRDVPGLQLAAELARLRQLIETGELATGARNREELRADEKVTSARGVL